MRKLFLIATSILLGAGAYAQPWMEGLSGDRIKLEDVIHNYEQQKQVTEAEGVFEGKGYHFDRWRWYHEGRTDENGYIVSPMKVWQEAIKLRNMQRASHKNTSVNVNWTFHGPTNAFDANKGLGRINIIEFHPTDTNTYIIGTPGGGLWRTTDDGQSWSPLNDFLPVLGVADVDYNPQNPNTIYVCTGDRGANDTYSIGVLKSTDGGMTWDTTGFQFTFGSSEKTTSLLINPQDTSSLTLASSDGIFKSYNAGVTWTREIDGFFQKLVYHPTDTNIIYASGSVPNLGWEIFRSTDGGDTWTASTNLPNVRRVEIAATKANPAIVKAVVANNEYGLYGIYSSSDTGKTFSMIFDDDSCKKNILASDPKGDDCGGQGWYDLSIAISPIDSDLVIVGGVNTWFSINGGNSWTLANQYKSTVTGVTLVHADKHYHRFHPFKPGTLYECNDGGIYKTANPANSSSIWNNLSDGLGITQFYRNAVSSIASFVLGGSQDNGTKMLVGGTSKQMTGADGMDCQISPVDSNHFYTSQQYGELRRTINGGDNFKDIQNNIPGKPKGAWITPIVILPSNPNTILAGYEELFYSSDKGDNWVSISPNTGTNMERIAVTPLNSSYIYTKTGNLIRYSDDFGGNWSSIISNLSGSMSDIAVDPFNEKRIWATYRSYQGDKVAYYDLDSFKWTKFNSGLPEVPVNCIAFDEFNLTVYIGTDLGVYYKEFHKQNWEYFNNNTLPNVEVIDLGLDQTNGTIWAATYGRGMWSSPVHKSTLGIPSTTPLAEGVIKVIPNPNKGSFNVNTNNNTLKNSVVTARVVSMTGTTVWEDNVMINANGNATITADLPRGNYIVEVAKSGVSFAKAKMIVH